MSIFRRLAAFMHPECVGCLAKRDVGRATVEEATILALFTFIKIGEATIRDGLCHHHRETIEKMCCEISIEGERAS